MDAVPLIVLGLVIYSVVWIVSFYVRDRRKRAVQAIAETLGFQFLGNGIQHIPLQARELPLFNKGRARRAENVIRGKRSDVDVLIFDYCYRIGRGNNSSTHYQTVITLTSDRLALPRFWLGPENLFHKIGQFFGLHDINFSDYPDFSKRYLLKGEDEAGIRRAFHHSVLLWFEARKSVNTEGVGRSIIYYHLGRNRAPDFWRSHLEEALSLYRQFVK
ncbi:MAG: hypothetical protein IGR92_12595 [Leptolyngbyaceae cyanobacterium T60_A2020_046]|nr:hypothetical protein [Leptolyngbyaceae cyanobacterium T60_A2020_046]